MKATKKDGIKVTEFDSIQELVTYINTTKITPIFADKLNGPASLRKGKTGDDWSGTSNLEEALDLLKHGWSEKAKELEEKLTQKINREASQVVRQKSVYDVVGGNCSVPRYLQGVPTSMIRQVRTPVKQKTITISYNITFNCGTTAEQITDNAVECLAYVKQLEDSGTRVTLNVVFVAKEMFGDNKCFGWSVPIKKTSERFSLSKAAFCLCHASMLRRILFSCIERDPDVTPNFVSNYGKPVRRSDELEKIFPGVKFYS